MILVTGATGLVGSHLLLKLIEQEEQIVALFRSESKKKITLKFLEERAKTKNYNKIIWRKGDLCNQPSLATAFEGITHLYHKGLLTLLILQSNTNSKKLHTSVQLQR